MCNYTYFYLINVNHYRWKYFWIWFTHEYTHAVTRILWNSEADTHVKCDSTWGDTVLHFQVQRIFFVFKILGYIRDSIFYIQMIPLTHWVRVHNIVPLSRYPQPWPHKIYSVVFCYVCPSRTRARMQFLFTQKSLLSSIHSPEQTHCTLDEHGHKWLYLIVRCSIPNARPSTLNELLRFQSPLISLNTPPPVFGSSINGFVWPKLTHLGRSFTLWTFEILCRNILCI